MLADGRYNSTSKVQQCLIRDMEALLSSHSSFLYPGNENWISVYRPATEQSESSDGP
jgi:hypothetical protein